MNLTIGYMDKLEEEFKRNDYNGVKTEDESFKVIEGNKNILISCAHSIDQVRKGMLKPRELYSGALCKLIQEYTDCYAIYKYHNDGIDDNFVLHTKYKERIGKLVEEKNISLVIDIHGMVGSKSKRFRGYHVELGTDDGRNLLGKNYISKDMKNSFNKYGVDRVVIDKQFKASRNHTIAKYVSTNYNVAAVQVEISGDFRNAANYKIENIEKLLNAFIEIVNLN